jgi:hypothetical protein
MIIERRKVAVCKFRQGDKRVNPAAPNTYWSTSSLEQADKLLAPDAA